MSKVVDERVVSMEFDNKEFERNTKTTISTLDKLKQHLNLEGASKGLENIDKAARNVHLSGLSDAANAVAVKFSALEVAGMTVISNLTNSAVNAGKRIISSFTIDPVKTGFNEYELKMNSVQTIMASTGEKLETVNGYLNELNEYSDRTIYSFSDMTQNIGKFTNAGVKLEDAVLAIKGVSNEAAVSGANANEASRAMYNFAQALSAGYVKLIDWKSIENANMATVEFKQQLIDSAVATGQLTKSSDGMYKTLKGNTLNATKNFNECLQDQWMTTEVLIGTLKNYADENTEIGSKAYGAAQDVKTFTMMMDTLKESVQSGWAETWETIIGNFEEAKNLWTNVTKFFDGVLGTISKSRNAILGDALNSKWDTFLNKIEAAGIKSEAFGTKLTETLKKHCYPVDDLIKKYGSLKEAFQKGVVPLEFITETLKEFANVEGSINTGNIKNISDKLEYFQKVVNEVWRGAYGNTGTYVNGEDRISRLTAAGYDYNTVQKLVDKTVDGHILTMEDLVAVQVEMSDAQLENIGYTEEEIKAIRDLAAEAEKSGTPINDLINSLSKKSGRELLIESVSNAVTGLKTSLTAVQGAWEAIFPPKSETEKANILYRMIESLNAFSRKLLISDVNAGKLQRTFKGLFAIIDIITSFIGGGFKIAWTILSEVLKAFNLNILDVTAYLGDASVKLRDWIAEHDLLGKAISAVVPILVESIKGIRNWIDGVKDINDIPKFIIEGLANGIKDGVDKVWKVVNELATNIISWFKKPLEIASPSKVFFALGGFIIAGLIGGLAYCSGDAIGFIKSLGLKIIDTIKQLDIGQVIGGLIAAGSLFVLGKFANAFTNLVSPIESFSYLMETVAKCAKKKIKAEAFREKAKGILMLAGAIGVMATALFIISKIDKESLLSSVVAISALAVVLGILAIAVNKMSKSSVQVDKKGIRTIGNSATYILGMAASMLLIALAMKTVSKLDSSEIAKGTAFVLAVGLLFVALTAVSKLAGKNASSAGRMLIKMSLAFLIMVAVVKLSASISQADLKKGTSFIIGVGLLFAACIAVSVLAGRNATKAGRMLLLMSSAFLIMIGVVKLAAGLSGDELNRGLGFIRTVGFIFGAFIAVSAIAGKNAGKAGFMLLEMSLAFAIMAGSMKILSYISDDAISRSLKVITAFGIISAALMIFSNFIGPNMKRIAPMLIAFSVALGILSLAIFGLSLIKEDGLKRAVAAITIMGVMFSVLLKATKNCQNCTKSLIAMTVAIGILVGALIALTFIDGNKIAYATAALVSIIGAMSLLVFAIQGLGKDIKAKTFFSIIGMLAALSVVMILITALLNRMTEGDKDPAKALAASKAMSLVLLSLSASCLILGLIGKIGPSAFIGIGVFAALVAVMGGLMAGMAALVTDKEAAEKGLDSAIMIFKKIGEAIGGFIGGIVGAFSIEALAGIGAGLSEFMTNLQPFLTGAKNIDKDSMLNVACLAGGIIALADANFIEGVTSMLPFIGSLSSLGSELSLFMNNLSGFIDGANGINSSDFESIKEIIGIIVKLSAAEFLDSCSKILSFGKESFGSFAKQLLPFARAITGFSKEIATSGIDQAAVTAAKDASDVMSAMANNLPTEPGAIAGWFCDHTVSMDEFGKQLVPYARAMIGFSKVVASEGIDQEAVNAAKTASDIMSAMANNLPTEPGAISGWFTDHTVSMSEFGKQLVPYARAMTRFSSIIATEGINQSAVNSAKAASDIMSAMATGLPSTPGAIAGWFVDGTLSMDKFGEQLVPYARAMTRFSKIIETEGINQSAVSSAKYASDIMSAMATGLPTEMSTIKKWFVDHTVDMDDFGSRLVPYGRAIAKFSKTVDGHVNEGAIQAAKNASDMLSSMEENLPDDPGLIAEFLQSILGGGKVSMEEFGVQITKFGDAIVAFSNSVDGKVNTNTLTVSVNTANTIIDILKNIKDYTEVDVTAFKNSAISFGEAMRSLSDIVTGIDLEAVRQVGWTAKDIADAIATVSTTNKFTTNVILFTNGLVRLATGMNNFSEMISEDFNSDSVKSVTDIGKDIAGMFKDLPSNVNYTDFATNLGRVGTGIKEFAKTATDGFMMENVYDAIEIGNKIIEVLSSADGYVDCSDVIENLGPLGEGISEFASSIDSSFDKDAVIDAATAGQKIINVISSMSNYSDTTDFISTCGTVATGIVTFWKKISADGGISADYIETASIAGIKINNMLATIAPYMDVTDFVSTCETVASGIVTFYKKITENGGISAEDIENATSAGTSLTNMLATIVPYMDTTDFIDNCVAAANGLVSFYNTVLGVNPAYVETVSDAGKKLTTFMGTISLNDTSDFEKDCTNVGTGLNEFYKKVSGENAIDTATINNSVASGLKINDLLTKLSGNDTSGFVESATNIIDGIKDFSDKAKNSIDYSAISYAKTSGDKIIDLINKYSCLDTSTCESSFASAAKSIVDFSDKVKGKFDKDAIISAANCGDKVIEMIKGIDNMDSLTTFATELPKLGSALSTFVSDVKGISLYALKPSFDTLKELIVAFSNAANICIDAFLQPFNDSNDRITESITTMLSNAYKACQTSTENGFQPVITPVLDLSEVNKGNSLLNNIFGNNPTLNVGGSLSFANSASSLLSNNTFDQGNQEVLDAINGVKESIAGISGDTYNVNGVTYDDGSNVSTAIKSLIKAAQIARRS